jgi:hypothetical protein
MRVAVFLVPVIWLFLLLAAPTARGGAVETNSRSAKLASGEKSKRAGEISSFARLKLIGEQVARAITEKKFEDIYSFLCASDKARTTKKQFASTLRDLHETAKTATADLGTDAEIVRENRRSGAESPADLDKLATVMLPLRLHFVSDRAHGIQSTTVQVWVFHREGNSWCTPLDDAQ